MFILTPEFAAGEHYPDVVYFIPDKESPWAADPAASLGLQIGTAGAAVAVYQDLSVVVWILRQDRLLAGSPASAVAEVRANQADPVSVWAEGSQEGSRFATDVSLCACYSRSLNISPSSSLAETIDCHDQCSILW